MAKKTKTVSTCTGVKTANGSFTKFYRLPTEKLTPWQATAMSYLDTRAEFKAGMVPGYVEIDGLHILGFSSADNRFIS